MIITGVTLVGDRVVDASIITQNLAIWIDANNASSYPGTGTTITDLSGNGRTQNLASAAQYTVLNGVKCFDCNSSSIYPTSATPTPTSTSAASATSAAATSAGISKTAPASKKSL